MTEETHTNEEGTLFAFGTHWEDRIEIYRGEDETMWLFVHGGDFASAELTKAGAIALRDWLIANIKD
jgi:hypothetical protein